MSRLTQGLSGRIAKVLGVLGLGLLFGATGVTNGWMGQDRSSVGITIFFFSSGSDQSEATWLQYGVPLGVALNLLQNPAIDLRHPIMFPDRLRQMGLPDLVGLTRTTARVIAREQNQEWFLLGEVSDQDEAIQVSVSLFGTQNGRSVAEHSYTGIDALALAESISKDIRQDLELPTPTEGGAEDRLLANILTGNPQAYRYYVEGIREDLATRDPSGAVSLFEKSVEEDPGFASAHHALSRLYLRMNRLPEAATSLGSAMAELNRLPDRAQFQVRADYYRVVEGDLGKALRELEVWSERHPDDVMAYWAQARVLSEMGEHDRALAQVGKVLEVDRSNGSELMEMGDSWFARGDSAVALRYYRNFADRFPGWAGQIGTLAEAARRRGNLEEARNLRRRAVLLSPEDPEVWSELAVIEAGMGDPESAVSLYEEGVARAETAEGRAKALVSLGTQFMAMGQSAMGMTYLEKAFEEAADYSSDVELMDLKLGLVRTLVAGGREAEAFALVEEAGQRYAGELEGALVLARVYLHLDRGDPDSLEAAIRLYESVFPVPDEGPTPSTHHFFRAKLHEHRGEWRQAIQRWEARQEVYSGDPSFGMSIGPCYRELGEYDRAVEFIQEALVYYPFGIQTNLEMALTYEAMGRLEDARLHLERTLRWYVDAEPDHPMANRARELAGRIGLSD